MTPARRPGQSAVHEPQSIRASSVALRAAHKQGFRGHADRSLGLSVLLTVALLIVVLFLLRPGYWINDDLKMAWLLAGYPGPAQVSPFPLHSNVLIGLFLLPLFRSAGGVNWFAVLLALTNTLTTAALVYLAVSGNRRLVQHVAACLIVLVCMALFILEVSYTATAFLAALAGVLLIWASGRASPSGPQVIVGGFLILLGSLIRLQMLAVAVAVSLLPLLLMAAHKRRFAMLLAATGLAVLATYGFNRLYVRARPDWNQFQAYTTVRQNIHDSHRLFNVHSQIRRIGWTPNDQELFARWFYPDEQLYSYERLRFLDEHVSPYAQDIGAALGNWLPGMIGGRSSPYVLMIFGLIIGASGQRQRWRQFMALIGCLLAPLVVNAAFAIAYKDPDYVQASTVAAAVFMATAILGYDFEPLPAASQREGRQGSVERILRIFGLIVAALGAACQTLSIWSASSTNAVRRAEYIGIRSQLADLALHGMLPPSSLIISPAHGLPYEWSDPFLLDRPVPAYLDTGWITFSPPYEVVLDAFGIENTAEALLTRDDVFLMTQEDFEPFLRRYFEEHGGVAVDFDVIYEMPNPSRWPGYDGIRLYQVRPVR